MTYNKRVEPMQGVALVIAVAGISCMIAIAFDWSFRLLLLGYFFATFAVVIVTRLILNRERKCWLTLNNMTHVPNTVGEET